MSLPVMPGYFQAAVTCIKINVLMYKIHQNFIYYIHKKSRLQHKFTKNRSPAVIFSFDTPLKAIYYRSKRGGTEEHPEV